MSRTMTLEQLHQRNERFQKDASQLVELVPGGNMLEFASLMIRGAKKIEEQLKMLLSAKTEHVFHINLIKMEEEMDEVIFILDRVDETNRSKKIRFIDEFVKRGYELLSIYSICCDQLIERKTKSDEFE